MKAYKLRLYPKKEEIEKLELSLEVCRQTYNNLLSELNNGYTKNEIQNWLLDLKVVYPEMDNVHSKVLQMENQRLFSNLSSLSAVKKKGKKVGRLRFKGKNWFKTFTYNQSGFKIIQGNKKRILRLSKIGDIPIRMHRKVEGNTKQVVIKKFNEKWYAMIITDFIELRKCGNRELGIDLGVNNYLVDSEETYVEHPKFMEKNKQLLRQAHKNLSRKKLRSKNRLKARKILARTYEKVRNRRDDFLHKLSNEYIRKCRIIAVEDLEIKQMMQSSYNAKNIADSSWGRFLQFLTYKAESAGCKIVKIDPRNTTKCCSNCGNIQEIKLYQRIYNCNNCGLSIDRDYNSAINIYRLGTNLCGDDVRPLGQLSEKQEAMPLISNVRA